MKTSAILTALVAAFALAATPIAEAKGKKHKTSTSKKVSNWPSKAPKS